MERTLPKEQKTIHNLSDETIWSDKDIHDAIKGNKAAVDKGVTEQRMEEINREQDLYTFEL